jgi:hypothetical protein
MKVLDGCLAANIPGDSPEVIAERAAYKAEILGLAGSKPTMAKVVSALAKAVDELQGDNGLIAQARDALGEAARVETKKTKAKAKSVKKPLTVEAAEGKISALERDPEATKSTVRTLAKNMQSAGLITEKQLVEIERISKDRDMGPQDLLDELKASLRNPSPESKPAAEPAAEAAPEPTAEPAAIQATPEQRKEAEAHAKDMGGEVVWQRGDNALIRGFSLLSGDPVYVPTMGSRRAKVDVSSFMGKQIPENVVREMLDAKEKLEAQAEEKHLNTPFIKFRDNVAVSSGVSPAVAGVIKEWKALLKLDAPIYVSTIEDAKANRNNFTGPHRRIGSGTLDANEQGSMRRMPDGSYYILFTKGTNQTKMLETIAHELGHVHQREVYENASAEDKAALQAAHKEWLAEQKGKTAKELVESLRARSTGRSTRVPEGASAEDMGPYWKSFSEWYADQTSRWATSAERPVSVVEKFFAKLGAALREFFQTIKGQKYLPNEAFTQYIERLLADPISLEPPAPKAKRGAAREAALAEAKELKKLLAEIIDSPIATAQQIRAADNQLALLDDPELNESVADMKGNHKQVKAELARIAKLMGGRLYLPVIPKEGQDLIGEAVNDWAREYERTHDIKLLPVPLYKGRDFTSSEKELLQKGDVNAILDGLISSEKNPALRQTLKRIRALNLKTKIEFAPISGAPDGLFQQDAAGGELYHRSSMPTLKNIGTGDTFTLAPGPQGAEGKGAYFSQGTPVRPTTAEGTRETGQTAVIVMQTPSREGWYVSKLGKTQKFGKPRTWHTDNKNLDLRVVDIKEINGERFITVEPVSNWVQPRADILFQRDSAPSRDEKFKQTREAQRYGTGVTSKKSPEDLGTEFTYGGRLQMLLEHVGDLVNRAAMPSNPNEAGAGVGLGGVRYGLEAMREKVGRALRDMERSEPSEYTDQIDRNAAYQVREGKAKSKETFVAEADAWLEDYANAYAQIPVHTKLQELSRDAAVALGRKDFAAAKRTLQQIDKLINSDKAETHYEALMDDPFTGPEIGNTPLGDLLEVEVDGVKRPVFNSSDRPIYPTQEGVRNFWRWFGNSKTVDWRGRPIQLYHGTARDITEFRAKQAGAIFVTEDSRFAEGFADMSRDYMTKEALQSLPEAERKTLEKQAWKIAREKKTDLDDELYFLVQDRLPSGRNILPLYTKTERPFDYKNREHVEQVAKYVWNNPNPDPEDRMPANWIRSMGEGGWSVIESRPVQRAIRALGYDGFFVREGGQKNLAVYSPTQLKSASGNRGTFDPASGNIMYKPARGMYDPAVDTIYLDPQHGMSSHTFVHEVVHAAISKALKNPSHPLTKQFEEFFMSVQGRLGVAYGATDLQEFAAELVSNPRFQAVLKSIKTLRSESMFRNIMRAIAEFLGFSPKSSAFDVGLNFVNDIIDISGDMKPTSMEKLFLGNGDLDIIAKVGKAMPALTGDTVEQTRNYLSNLPTDLMKFAFGLLRLDNIYTLYKKELPSIKALMDAVEQRAGSQERQIADIQKKYKEMLKAERAHRPQMQKMSDIAIQARLEEVDLLNPKFKPTAAQAPVFTRLKNQFEALPKPVQEVYRTIRKDYDASFYKHRKILLAAAETSPSLATKLREQFAKDVPLVSYVPFLRSGDFWVSYADPDTNTPAAFAFESIREREQFIKLLDQKKIAHRVYQNLEDIRYTSESIPQSSFVFGVMQELSKQGASQAQKDAVWQSYLATFPSGSIMKQFMKSKNALGMKSDIINGYGDVMVRWARKLANAEFGPQIDRALHQITGEAGKQSDPAVNAAAQNILGQAQFLHNPTHNNLTTAATTTSYFMFMAGNISSALINVLSMPMMVWPKLVGDFNWDSATRASFAAGRTAMNDWSKLPRYKNLYETMMSHAQLEHTQAREVLEGRKQKTSDFTSTKAKLFDGLSLPLAATERYNRAVTAIAAYELMRGKGASDADAVQYALQTTKDIHTSGMAATGPRWMQGPIGRVFFTFKSFVWNQAFVTARAFHQAFKGEKPEIRAAARRQLVAMYGMAFAFAGLRGMPFYGAASVLSEMISALFGDDDEPFDFDQFLKDSTNDFIFKGAFNYATNVEVATRAGVANDLLFRDDPRFIAEHGYMLFAMTQALGPASSLLMNAGRGYEQFQEGNIGRAIETVSPSWVRNGLKGGRYMVEGATTLKGDPVMEDIGAYNSLMQLIGFAPADLSDRYERLQAAKGFEREVGLRRTNLLHLADMAQQAGDYDMLANAREKIAAFNEANPAFKITQNTLDRSARARQAAEKEMIYGVRFNKKLRPVIEEQFFSDEEDYFSDEED